MPEFLKKDRWSAFVVGTFLAILSVSSFYFLNHTLGTSTAFVRIAASFWAVVNAEHLETNTYYKSYLDHNSWINWQSASVFGIFIGAYIAAAFSKQTAKAYSPEIWNNRFGSSRLKRSIGAFIGGVIILFGARLAGGCTSGHIISGGMQLAISGWLFMAGLFAAAIPTAFLLYKGGSKNGN
jgi:uncharacterized membrane protein YedE/YeeE